MLPLDENRCKHGLVRDECAFCSGLKYVRTPNLSGSAGVISHTWDRLKDRPSPLIVRDFQTD